MIPVCQRRVLERYEYGVLLFCHNGLMVIAIIGNDVTKSSACAGGATRNGARGENRGKPQQRARRRSRENRVSSVKR